MRLYLSSERIGDRAGSLLALTGSGRRAANIANGYDHVAAELRQLFSARYVDPADELRALGYDTVDLDLRDYFGAPQRLRRALEGVDLVWVPGGNAFVLRRAMRQSGFDDLVTELLDADALVYGGADAGAMVAAPTLEGLDMLSDPAVTPIGYQALVPWDGLGLIDHSIVTHYRSPTPDSAGAERAVRYLSRKGLRYRALRDGEAIIWVESRGTGLGRAVA
jgi:dipeptidase E